MKTSVSTLIAIVAMVVSIATLLISVDWSKQDTSQTTAEERIVELEREIAHLKGTVYETDLVSSDGAVSAPTQTELTTLVDTDQDRINHLVESMRWTMTVRGLMNPTTLHIERAHGMIFDDKVNTKRKLVALRILQTCGKRSDDVARKMVEEYYKTSDFNLQAEIFNILDGVDTPEFAQAILEASSSSPNARVRKEAVDALSGFLPDPELIDWLQQVATTDKNKDVRREADRLLNKHAEVASN